MAHRPNAEVYAATPPANILQAARIMEALDVDEEPRKTNERPTIPVPAPRDSGIRLRVARVPITGATVDVVMCDLSRDPRSEDFAPDRVNNVSPLRRRGQRPRRLF
jgi:hypothetical protein